MRNGRLVLVLFVALFAIFASSSTTRAQNHLFMARLNGAQETPSNASEAEGRAIFTLSPDGTALRFVIIINGIEHITDAHLHLGALGQTAPPVASLQPHGHDDDEDAHERKVQVLRGTIKADDLYGSLAGATSLNGLIDALQAGKVYINIHSEAYPKGEIRGQVAPFPRQE